MIAIPWLGDDLPPNSVIPGGHSGPPGLSDLGSNGFTPHPLASSHLPQGSAPRMAENSPFKTAEMEPNTLPVSPATPFLSDVFGCRRHSTQSLKGRELHQFLTPTLARHGRGQVTTSSRLPSWGSTYPGEPVGPMGMDVDVDLQAFVNLGRADPATPTPGIRHDRVSPPDVRSPVLASMTLSGADSPSVSHDSVTTAHPDMHFEKPNELPPLEALYGARTLTPLPPDQKLSGGHAFPPSVKHTKEQLHQQQQQQQEEQHPEEECDQDDDESRQMQNGEDGQQEEEIETDAAPKAYVPASRPGLRRRVRKRYVEPDTDSDADDDAVTSRKRAPDPSSDVEFHQPPTKRIRREITGAPLRGSGTRSTSTRRTARRRRGRASARQHSAEVQRRRNVAKDLDKLRDVLQVGDLSQGDLLELACTHIQTLKREHQKLLSTLEAGRAHAVPDSSIDTCCTLEERSSVPVIVSNATGVVVSANAPARATCGNIAGTQLGLTKAQLARLAQRPSECISHALTTAGQPLSALTWSTRAGNAVALRTVALL